MTGTIAERAEGLATSGRRQDALRLLKDAGRRGNVDALYALAVWHLIGERVRRDLFAARHYLRQAIAIGHVDAALMEIALTANGGGGQADWGRAVALLRMAAANDPLAAEHLALIEAMALDACGAPMAGATAEPVSASPDARLFRALLTPAECAHIATTARDMLEPASVVDPATGRFVAHPVRTSHSAVIGPARETLVVQAINRRLAAASGTDVTQGEPLTVLHYAPGQQYRPHHDALPPQIARGNQRVLTMLAYLNQGYEGGETRFTPNGPIVRGRAGDVLMFANVRPDGAPDPAAQHAGLPVTRGAKWLATRWIRALPYDPWALT
ncbi:2OG-Fe(II) oxygenase [Sphingomonas profundi]|uniref:2OG-Fe(II) oxygenase n=1 Tax=Alterirhizorhabdus profundi TaxID=2681549 RepID=UPI0012E7AEDD|nr:2OG-Fe(II) oxygenase [Sphingomonas profundi]